MVGLRLIEVFGKSEGQVVGVREVKVILKELVAHEWDDFLVLCLVDWVIQELVFKRDELYRFDLVNWFFLYRSDALHLIYHQ